MQQSWQTDHLADIPTRAREAWRGGGTIAAAKAALKQAGLIVALPRLEDSLAKLERVQDAAGHKLPVIVHPNEQWLGEKPSGRQVDYRTIRRSGTFGPLRYQVTAELLERWGVLSKNSEQMVEDMYATVEERKEFDEAVVDGHHIIMRRGGVKIDDPAAVAGKMARDNKLSELQICFRPDFGGDPDELKSVLDTGFDGTKQGEIITAVGQELPPGTDLYAVIETPEAAFSAAGINYWDGLKSLAEITRASLPNLQ